MMTKRYLPFDSMTMRSKVPRSDWISNFCMTAVASHRMLKESFSVLSLSPYRYTACAVALVILWSGESGRCFLKVRTSAKKVKGRTIERRTVLSFDYKSAQ